MNRRWTMAAAAVALAVAPVIAGCQPALTPVPPTFAPASCPPGWHLSIAPARDDWGCTRAAP